MTGINIEKYIKILVEESQKGNTESLAKILDQLKPLRLSLGKRFGNKGIEFDDLVSQIDLLIIESVMNYNENKDSSALRHIVSRTKNGIWNYYRKEMNYFNNNKTSIPIDPTEIENLFNSEIFIDDDSISDKIEITNAINKLTKKQRIAIEMYYFKDMMDSEIANLFNIDQSNATRVRQRGILALYKILSDY